MAKLYTFKLGEDYLLRLSRLRTGSTEIIKKAIYQGADVVADAIKESIYALPEEPYRKLRPGELFNGVSQTQKEGIADGFGLTDMEPDGKGWNTKAGFDGYIPGTESKKYPKGLPVLLLARSIESGSSVRRKYPFVRKAVNAVRREAIETMERVIDEEIQKTMK